MYYFSYATTEGIVKKINQDALMIKTARYGSNHILMSAVCDGMGGLSGGETASSFVITGVSDWFESTYPSLLREESNILKIRQSLDELLHILNDDINKSCAKGSPMGTTFTGILIDPALNIMLAAHVGDTRLYKIYSDRLEIVTSDHSVVAEEVRRGVISAEQAMNDTRQNQITNCIGAGEKNRVYDYIMQPPEKDCLYMLCSDGFRKMVTEEELIKYLSPDVNNDNLSIGKNLEFLVNLNMQRMENDNITALAVKYTGVNEN